MLDACVKQEPTRYVAVDRKKNFKIFSTIQILREINLGNFKASVNSNFGFCRFAKKSQKIKQTLNEDLKLPKLVAPKMWIAEKVSNFYRARNAR